VGEAELDRARRWRDIEGRKEAFERGAPLWLVPVHEVRVGAVARVLPAGVELLPPSLPSALLPLPPLRRLHARHRSR
jgi:hypothetical protein